ncbi:MAG: zinc ribbon domain-containing protein [Candidatus Bathyarchaeia archaeon]
MSSLVSFREDLHWGMGFGEVTRKKKPYVLCGSCGKLIPVRFSACMNCRRPFPPEYVYCPYCRVELIKNSDLCPYCGSKLDKSPAYYIYK